MGMNRRVFLSSVSAALLSSATRGIERCFIDDSCGPHQGPGNQGNPPNNPPETPPQPPTTPSGIQASLYDAFNMNAAGSNQQIYTVGWSSAPNGFHPILANDASQDGLIRYGGYNHLITTQPMDPTGVARVDLQNSQQGLGEQFLFDGNRLVVELEQMDWGLNSWYRRFKRPDGGSGLFWGRLDLPSGTDVFEHTLLDYYRCLEPRGTPGEGELFEQHESYALNRLYGPYDITTPIGMEQARAEVTFQRNRDNPLGIPDVWKTFPAQLGHPNAHMIIYALRDLWGPRDNRDIRDLSHWGNMEGYFYGVCVEPDGSWRRGVGLIGWLALDEPNGDFTGEFVPYRQQIQTTIRQGGRTRMLGLCELPSGSSQSKIVGLGMLNNWYQHDTSPLMLLDGYDGPRFADAPYGTRNPRGSQRIKR